ncbi:MAG: BrnA antitoxin family protein, partial [Rhodospirillaceae bacterium]
MKRKLMKTARSKPAARPEDDELRALAAQREEEIDTRDIPEVRDWTGARRGVFYRPVKRQLTLRLDADVVAWFKARAGEEGGYQTDINRALREYVEEQDRNGLHEN